MIAVELLARMLAGGGKMLVEYLSFHVLTCLIPAFFIAGAITVFISAGSILKYLGPTANRYVSYGVASVSGTVLAVCSCTILPMFAGIRKGGAGLGPAVTFLYSGPAINLLAIVLTARQLGLDMGVARAVGAIGFSVVIGAIMAFLYRHEEKEKDAGLAVAAVQGRSAVELVLFFGVLVAILLFGAAKGIPGWSKVAIIIALLNSLAIVAGRFSKAEVTGWMEETYKLFKQIFPVLLAGVFVAGMLASVLPPAWVAGYVGDNSLRGNFIAALAGALMYFSTLTEVPILQALMGLGMDKGPALSLLLAGPAVSIPNLLVLVRVMGAGKTMVYLILVVALATLTGMAFGALF